MFPWWGGGLFMVGPSNEYHQGHPQGQGYKRVDYDDPQRPHARNLPGWIRRPGPPGLTFILGMRVVSLKRSPSLLPHVGTSAASPSHKPTFCLLDELGLVGASVQKSWPSPLAKHRFCLSALWSLCVLSNTLRWRLGGVGILERGNV